MLDVLDAFPPNTMQLKACFISNAILSTDIGNDSWTEPPGCHQNQEAGLSITALSQTVFYKPFQQVVRFDVEITTK